MARKRKEFKRCPRCDTKALIHQDKCNACGLIYSRLINASNKEAKKALKAGQKNRVIYDKTLPKDMNKWKLFFMALFLGPWGGHYYYIGKKKTGFVFTVCLLLLLITVGVLQEHMELWAIYGFWLWLGIIPEGACFVAYAIDVVRILSNSFRVPIALKEDSIIVDKSNEKADSKAVLKIVEEVGEKVEKEAKNEQKPAQKQENDVEKVAKKPAKKTENKDENNTENIDENNKDEEQKNHSKSKQNQPEKSSKKKGKK